MRYNERKFINRGACRQAERKVCPSTREPDVGNANVGIQMRRRPHIYVVCFFLIKRIMEVNNETVYNANGCS